MSFSMLNSEQQDLIVVSITLHNKWSFPLRISSVNMTKSAANCGVDHIYWRNIWWKTLFFAQCNIFFLGVLVGTGFEVYKDGIWINRGMSSLLKKLFDSHLVPPGIPCSKNITNNENERSKFKVTLRTITHFKSYLILSNNSALSDAIIPTIETI